MPPGHGRSSRNSTGGWISVSHSGCVENTTKHRGRNCSAIMRNPDAGNAKGGAKRKGKSPSSPRPISSASPTGAYEYRMALGGVQHPRVFVRATRGNRHAWRAGCRETCTSGSGRGMKKPAPATGPGASSLLYAAPLQPSGPEEGPDPSAPHFCGTKPGAPLGVHAATCSSASVTAVSVLAASGAKPRMKSAAFDAALAARTIALESSCKTSSQEPI